MLVSETASSTGQAGSDGVKGTTTTPRIPSARALATKEDSSGLGGKAKAHSRIRAADMGTGRPVPTDSVTLNGVPFPVILPDQPYKHLGVRGTMLGDFTAEKQHVLGDMAKKLKALQEDRLLTRKEKEQVIITAVCSVFNYSAGVVDWTKVELDHISKMWATAYKQAWTLPRSADGSPFLLDQSHAGRGCPSATGMWTRAVLEVLEQSVGLPGEISEMVLQHLQRQCTAYGCQTLNQLQLMLRVSGKAETVLELFLQRLDEYGLEISSPWRSSEEESLAEVLWPALHRSWLRNMDISERAVSRLRDPELAATLCQHRAIFPLPQTDHDVKLVECLVPLRRVLDPYPLPEVYILARVVDSPETPIAALSLALVRDCLLGDGRESLHEACLRPQWVVTKAEFYSGYFPVHSSYAPAWALKMTSGDGQAVLTGLVQYISTRHCPRVHRPAVVLHPWQIEPPIPSNVIIDTTHHFPRSMPSPEGWEVWQRNGRLWIAKSRSRVAMIDAAQYGMLVTMVAGSDTQPVPSSQFLQQLRESCLLQLGSDSTHGVSWSRHLMANIQKVSVVLK